MELESGYNRNILTSQSHI